MTLLQIMPKLPFSIQRIDILSSAAFAHQISGSFKIGHYSLNRTLCDPDSNCDLPQRHIRMLRQKDENVPVVTEKRPLIRKTHV